MKGTLHASTLLNAAVTECNTNLSQRGHGGAAFVRARNTRPWDYSLPTYRKRQAMQHVFRVTSKQRLSTPPQHVLSGSGSARVASTRGVTIPVQHGVGNLALCHDVAH